MNNIEGLINGGISLFKSSSLIVATIFSFFPSAATSSPTTNFLNTKLSDSTKKEAVANTDKIINVLNFNLQSTSISSSSQKTTITNVTESTTSLTTPPITPPTINVTTSTSTVQKTAKLNKLNLTAPTYSKLEIRNKKDASKSSSSKIVSSGSLSQKDSNTINSMATNSTSTSPSNVSNNTLNKQISISTQGSEESVVNIRCENKVSNTLKVITGSGVLINSTGLILTAAHVAAPVYSEKNGGNYSCYARIKNPASGNYPVKIAFIDPVWINKYYSVFDQTHSETGESDVALLQIDNSGSKISDSDMAILNNTSYATLSSISPNTNDSIVIKSYPSDVYGKFGVFTVLPRKSETSTIGSLINFNGSIGGASDLLETMPSSLGQSGASGGGIFNTQGQLIGIISNEVSSNILLKNKIRALSINYIDSEIKINLGKSIFGI